MAYIPDPNNPNFFDSDGVYDKPYVFAEKPVAKSSTSVLKASVCQRCGCKLDGKPLTRPCDCKCHKEGPR